MSLTLLSRFKNPAISLDMTSPISFSRPKGIVIAAPSSGSGKTTITLALLRLMHRAGLSVSAAKCGPDYIDPRFHEAACHAECLNLDSFAMSPERIRALVPETDHLVVEGVMGLFDGSQGGRGSTAELARVLDLPVVLVVDTARMAGSVAALVHGFATFDNDVRLAGVILNNIGSDRHETMLRDALEPLDMPVLAALRRRTDLTHQSRHLGLVQAQERGDLDQFIDTVADHLDASLDLPALLGLMTRAAKAERTLTLPPPAQSIAIARDAAFAFAYPHLMKDWRKGGASIAFFSPLDDQPAPKADLIFLPGGYPELYAGKLSANTVFRASMHEAARNGCLIYGECGGYMTLGQALTDAEGTTHPMLGLLDLETSFAHRKLHLGYRNVYADQGPFSGNWAAHEFHYATTVRAQGTPLFSATDGWGATLDPMGLVNGSVSGSFVHIIDKL